MSDIINDQMLTTNLSIDAKNMDHDIDNSIKHILKDKLEGLCYEDGYILKGSLKIINRKLGKLKTTDNKSYINYIITYRAKVLSPMEGDKIEVYVSNINKMGVVSYIKINGEDTVDDSPLIILIPNEYFNDSVYNTNDININQKLNVVVVGSRIKFRSDKIQIIAKPVD